MLRAGYPTLLAWGVGGTIFPGSKPAGVTTRSLGIVTECLLPRSMLINMYVHDIYCQFRAGASMNMILSISNYRATIEFDDSFQP